MSEHLLPFSSLLFGETVGTSPMRSVWSEERLIWHWCRIERALTTVQADLGLVPAQDAETICRCLDSGDFTVQRILDKRQETGHLMVAFLKAFRDFCGPAAEHFHLGPTTQDILDTGLVRMIDESDRTIRKAILALEESLCGLALEHRETPVMGRSHGQHAVPATFGFLMAGWATEMRDHLDRALEARERWRHVSLSGAVGSRNSFVEMWGEETAREIERGVGRILDLPTSRLEWHSRTDRLAEPVSNLATLVGSLRKFALNLRWWQSSEVGEVAAPYDSSHYSSSTMPNKRNPEEIEHIVGSAALLAGLANACQSIAVQDNRDSTRLPVQLVAFPHSYLLAARSLETMTDTVSGLMVNPGRMRDNLDHPGLLGQAAGERLMLALYRKTDRRDWAHTVVHDCAAESSRTGQPLKEVIRDRGDVARLFDQDELEALFQLETYVGSASREAREAVKWLRRTRSEVSHSLSRSPSPPTTVQT